MKTPVYLNALRAFEASARHQSFSGAANELNVTPAAVGQLVRSLEEWLGILLFHRSTGGRARLIATDSALKALPDIRIGFERLSMGLAQLKEEAGGSMLTVTVSPAFAAKWLLPRLEHFQTAWPDLDLRLDTSLKPIDFVSQGIDIGVRYGLGSWPGLTAEKLMDEEIYPVCSPDLLRRHPELRDPSNIIHQTLIHDQSLDEHTGFISWNGWLQKAGIVGTDINRGLRINNSAAVLQSAIDGHGIALGRSVMARDDVSAGRLVRLFPAIRFASVLAYYIVYRPEKINLPKLLAFRNWLVAEATPKGD
jgi:LysR family transcriptional regulator, glycine cleavage system transcriptional activator